MHDHEIKLNQSLTQAQQLMEAIGPDILLLTSGNQTPQTFTHIRECMQGISDSILEMSSDPSVNINSDLLGLNRLASSIESALLRIVQTQITLTPELCSTLMESIDSLETIVHELACSPHRPKLELKTEDLITKLAQIGAPLMSHSTQISPVKAPSDEAHTSNTVRAAQLERLLELQSQLQFIHRTQNAEFPASHKLQWTTLFSEMEQISQSLRKTSIQSVFDTIRQTISSQNDSSLPRVRLVTFGENLQVDKRIVRTLEHLLPKTLREMIKQHQESKDQRLIHGKTAELTLSVSVSIESDQLYMSFSDDGSGTQGEAISKNFSPDILQLGGTVELRKRAGLGTEFCVTLPLSPPPLQGMVIESCNQTWVVPLGQIYETVCLKLMDQSAQSQKKIETFDLRGERLPVVRLNALLKQRQLALTDSKAVVPGKQAVSKTQSMAPATQFGLIVPSDHGKVALQVEAVVSHQLLEIEPIASTLDQMSQNIVGQTVLVNGSPARILNVQRLLSSQSAA